MSAWKCSKKPFIYKYSQCASYHHISHFIESALKWRWICFPFLCLNGITDLKMAINGNFYKGFHKFSFHILHFSAWRFKMTLRNIRDRYLWTSPPRCNWQTVFGFKNRIPNLDCISLIWETFILTGEGSIITGNAINDYSIPFRSLDQLIEVNTVF